MGPGCPGTLGLSMIVMACWREACRPFASVIVRSTLKVPAVM